jgi:hydroxymethylglutaryl-CoA synthase
MHQPYTANGTLQSTLLREKAHLQKGYTPKGSAETITKGTYYLTSVDDMFRRHYEIKA